MTKLSIALIAMPLFVACDLRPEADAADVEVPPSSRLTRIATADLLDEESLVEVIGLPEDSGLTCSVEDNRTGVRFEWPLPSRELVQRVNDHLVQASLASGTEVELLPSSGRVTLNQRSDGLSLVAIRDRLLEGDCGSEEVQATKRPQAVQIGEFSGLWCPRGRVLHFNTARGPMTLGVELGLTEADDHEAAIQLAKGIIVRSEKEFLESPGDAAEESWIQPRD